MGVVFAPRDSARAALVDVVSRDRIGPPPSEGVGHLLLTVGAGFFLPLVVGMMSME
jgi:hypothetical protein